MIPFVDLKQQYELHRDEFESRILEVCASSAFILGPAVARFEQNFAAYIGVREAVGVASGTDALRLACEALNIGPGDEVLIPANTFIATAIAVHQVGALPVPVDIHPDSFLIDLTDAEKRLTKQTRAIMPVHLYGQCLEMDSISAFSSSHNLVLIEDACQAHGASWNKRRAGSFGSAGCFSFYPGKNIGAFGDAGMVTTDNIELAGKLRLLRNYGSVEKYIHDLPGGNSRLDSIQAAILDIKLCYLDQWNRRRFDAACRYAHSLRGVRQVKAPVFDPDDPSRHVFHLFVIQCEKRDQLLSFLNECKIQCGIHYPIPVHLHKAFEHLGYGQGSFPVAEWTAENILSLPIFPEITDKQIDTVVDAIREFYG